MFNEFFFRILLLEYMWWETHGSPGFFFARLRDLIPSYKNECGEGPKWRMLMPCAPLYIQEVYAEGQEGESEYQAKNLAAPANRLKAAHLMWQWHATSQAFSTNWLRENGYEDICESAAVEVEGGIVALAAQAGIEIRISGADAYDQASVAAELTRLAQAWLAQQWLDRAAFLHFLREENADLHAWLLQRAEGNVQTFLDSKLFTRLQKAGYERSAIDNIIAAVKQQFAQWNASSDGKKVDVIDHLRKMVPLFERLSDEQVRRILLPKLPDMIVEAWEDAHTRRKRKETKQRHKQKKRAEAPPVAKKKGPPQWAIDATAAHAQWQAMATGEERPAFNTEWLSANGYQQLARWIGYQGASARLPLFPPAFVADFQVRGSRRLTQQSAVDVVRCLLKKGGFTAASEMRKMTAYIRKQDDALYQWANRQKISMKMLIEKALAQTK